jgi:hypothetical protein
VEEEEGDRLEMRASKKLKRLVITSSIRGVPEVPVLFEDDDLIVVNKPSLMLSVPGRHNVREPRHIEWMNSVKLASTSQEFSECGNILQQIAQRQNVPRKKASFIKWIQTNFKLNDYNLIDNIWNAIESSDRNQHKPRIESISPERVSVMECLEVFYPQIFAVHRLDCDTSGALVFAKSQDIASALGKQFQTREVSQHFLVLSLFLIVITFRLTKRISRLLQEIFQASERDLH